MPPKGSGKPKGKRKSAGNSVRVQAEAAAALAAAGGGTAATAAGDDGAGRRRRGRLW